MRNAHPFNLQSYKNFANLPHPVTFFKKSRQRNTRLSANTAPNP